MSRERSLRPTERSVANHDALVEDVERQLRQALSLEPSPDFARQVRARIEQTSSHRLPAVVLCQAALAAAAVCVLAVGTGWHFTRERPVHPSVAARSAIDVELAPAPGSAVEPPPPRSSARAVTRTGARARAAVVPEVIVSADRALALGRLLALTRSGAVNEESLRPVVVAAAPATLEVPPLVIPPISVPEVDTSGRAASGGPGQK